MMKFILTLVALIAVQTCVAQHLKFVPGKVVFEGQDTVRGSISYEDEPQLHRDIEFRRQGRTDVETLTASQINGFILLGESVRVFRAVRNLHYKTIDSEPIVDAFVEVKIDGPVSLGRMVDEGMQVHFFLTKDGATKELVDKVTYTVDASGRQMKRRDMGYTGLLKATLGDCGYSPKNPPGYSYFNFERAVLAYNNCRNVPSIKYKSKRRTNYFGASVGYVITSVKMKDSHYIFMGTYTEGSQFKTTQAKYDIRRWMDDNEMMSSSPMFSLYFMTISARNRHISTTFELMPVQNKWKTAVIDETSLVFNIPLAVKYSFMLARQAQPYLALGINAGIVASSTFNSATTAQEFDANTGAPLTLSGEPVWSDIGREFNPATATVTVTAGLDYYLRSSDKIHIGFRYEFGGGTVYSKPVHSNSTVFNFFLGYSLSKSARAAVARNR